MDEEPNSQRTSQRDPTNDGAVNTGWFLAVLFPIIGLLVGLVLMNRGDERGTGVIVASIVFGIAWTVVLATTLGEDQGTRVTY